MLSKKKLSGKALNACGVLFWLAVWQIAAMLIDKQVILVTPTAVIKRLSVLIFEQSFIKTAVNSFMRISAGFFAAFAAGTAAAALSYRYKAAKALISPIMTAAKTVPVASFIIFALFWMKSVWLSVLIPFLTAMPVIYSAVLEGAASTDIKLREAAEIFRFGKLKKIRYLYIPSVMPFLSSACSAASGLAFKSGIAAEVIGQPDFTMGDMLYRAKIYLETADLFAWTAVIIVLSKLFETIFEMLLRLAYKYLQKVK